MICSLFVYLLCCLHRVTIYSCIPFYRGWHRLVFCMIRLVPCLSGYLRGRLLLLLLYCVCWLLLRSLFQVGLSICIPRPSYLVMKLIVYTSLYMFLLFVCLWEGGRGPRSILHSLSSFCSIFHPPPHCSSSFQLVPVFRMMCVLALGRSF